MAEKTISQIDLIRMIGDILTEIDVLRGSVPRGTQKRAELDSWRLHLDAKQHALADAAINESDAKFKSASERVAAISDDVKQTIADVEQTARTFADLARLATALDQLLSLAAGAAI